MDFNYKILIVDDVADNIQVAMNVLKEEHYEFSFAMDGDSAMALMRSEGFDLVLLDIMMPGMDGFEVARRMKEDSPLSEIPVIFLTAKADIDSIEQGFELGGVDYITKPFQSSELLARVKTHLELHRAKALLRHNNLTLKTRLEKKTHRLLSELEESQKEMIFVLTELMESTSDETGKHIRRVAEYSRLLAHYHPSISEEDANIVYHASPMHDIGKIAIPERILHKPGKLDDDEFRIMQSHTTKAHEFLSVSSRKIIKAADIIAYEHHERWDGSGYPRGLSGSQIHIYGRIVALADVLDALTHKRVYKEAWEIERAVEYILDNRGKHFDPALVDIFEANLDEFMAIANL